MKPLLIMCGADKGGVGKTTVSRILIDYLDQNKFDFRAYDSESPAGVLKRFNADRTEVVDLTQVADQMKVFDTLQTHPVTLIDVRAGLLSPTLKTLGEVGLLDMVKNNQVTLMVLHVLGPSVASLAEIEATSKIIEGATHFLIKNHINDTEFFKWDPATYEKIFGAARSGIIEIPQLTELAVEHVENDGVTYSNFVSASKASFVLKGYVRTWMKAVFAAFDKANINGIVGSAISS